VDHRDGRRKRGALSRPLELVRAHPHRCAGLIRENTRRQTPPPALAHNLPHLRGDQVPAADPVLVRATQLTRVRNWIRRDI
jgi:hypothetical protein